MLRCSESFSTVVITLSCKGLPVPIATAFCSIDNQPPSPCEILENTKLLNDVCACYCPAGNVSSLDINLLDFTPEGHTLTINFTDVNGNEGSAQYNFTGQTRQGELQQFLTWLCRAACTALTAVFPSCSCVHRAGHWGRLGERDRV